MAIIINFPTFLLDECPEAVHPGFPVTAGVGCQVHCVELVAHRVDDGEGDVLWRGVVWLDGLEGVCVLPLSDLLDAGYGD